MGRGLTTGRCPAGGAGGLRTDQETVEFQDAVQRRRLHRETAGQARAVEQAFGRQDLGRGLGGPDRLECRGLTVAQRQAEKRHRDHVLFA
jgi:hypothetical protein